MGAAQIEMAHPPLLTVPLRSRAVDAVRGLAIVLMLVDHVALWAGAVEVRWTLGRLAMPLFFIVGGYCFRRLRWRHAGVLGLGVGLPLVVPWIDNPNVLVLYVGGCVLLHLGGTWGPVLLIAAALTAAGNGVSLAVGTGYDPLALWALMGLGALRRPAFFAWGKRLPAWVATVGRAPLRWYVGHLLVLQLMVVIWYGR